MHHLVLTQQRDSIRAARCHRDPGAAAVDFGADIGRLRRQDHSDFGACYRSRQRKYRTCRAGRDGAMAAEWNRRRLVGLGTAGDSALDIGAAGHFQIGFYVDARARL